MADNAVLIIGTSLGMPTFLINVFVIIGTLYVSSRMIYGFYKDPRKRQLLQYGICGLQISLAFNLTLGLFRTYSLESQPVSGILSYLLVSLTAYLYVILAAEKFKLLVALGYLPANFRPKYYALVTFVWCFTLNWQVCYALARCNLYISYSLFRCI